MKRLFFATICIMLSLFYCSSCCKKNRNCIFPYSELQDSLECFLSKAPKFPIDTPSFVCVIFHADSLEAKKDTVVVLMKGNGPFSPVNGQSVVGATCFDKHICEVVYDGFEHLPGIVNERILTLSTEDYIQYGYKEVYDNPQYQDWLYTSGIKNQKVLPISCAQVAAGFLQDST